MASDDTSASFGINLEDNVSGPAAAAASALQKLRDQIDSDTKALDSMNKAMRRLKQGGLGDSPQYKQLSAAARGLKEQIAQNQVAYQKAGGGLSMLGKQAGDTKGHFDQLRDSITGLPGPLGRASGHLDTFVKLVKGPAGAAAGLVIMAAALGYVTSKLTAYGIAQAEVRRNELLRLEGLTKLRTFQTLAFGIKPGNAQAMQQSIDKVSGVVAAGRDEIGKYNDQLYRMGLRGAALTQALEATAIKAQVQGDGAAQAFMGWAAAANMTGRSVKALADDVRARLGGIAAKQMLSLTVQTAKLKENFDALFRDLGIDAFLKGLYMVTSLFSQAKESGRALRYLITTMVQPLIDAVTAAMPLVKKFFVGMILASLDVAIAVVRLRNWFRKTFGDVDVLKGIDKMNLALTLGKGAVYGLLAAFVAFAGWATVTLIPLFWEFGVPILIATAALWGLYKILQQVWREFEKTWDYGLRLGQLLAETDWGALGGQILDGIVQGLKSGASALWAAVTDLGNGIGQAFKAALKISSPSKVFAELGKSIPDGVAMGITANAGNAQGAADTMLTPPAASGGGAQSSTAAKPTVTIGTITINAKDNQSAQSLAVDIRAALAAELETLVLQLGGAMP